MKRTLPEKKKLNKKKPKLTQIKTIDLNPVKKKKNNSSLELFFLNYDTAIHFSLASILRWDKGQQQNFLNQWHNLWLLNPNTTPVPSYSNTATLSFIKLAIKHDHLPIVKSLHIKDTKSESNENNLHLLHHAIRHGALRCFNFFYKTNSKLLMQPNNNENNPQHPTHGATLTLLSFYYGKLNILTQINKLGNALALHQTNKQGDTIAHLACYKNNIHMLEFINRHFRNKLTMFNLKQQQPIHIAVVHGQLGVFKYLLTVIENKKRLYLNLNNSMLNIAFYAAMKDLKKSIPILRYLFQHHRKLFNIQDYNKKTPIEVMLIQLGYENETVENKILLSSDIVDFLFSKTEQYNDLCTRMNNTAPKASSTLSLLV
jgi:hypothetical protein